MSVEIGQVSQGLATSNAAVNNSTCRNDNKEDICRLDMESMHAWKCERVGRNGNIMGRRREQDRPRGIYEDRAREGKSIEG